MAADLAKYLVPPPNQAVRYGQGKLLAWDPDTFNNRVLWNGVTLVDLPVLPSVDALSFKVGNAIGLLGWDPGGGTSSWWILGRVDAPPLAQPVSIQGADVILENGSQLVVNGGGDIVINDGGEIILSGNMTVQGGGNITVTDGNVAVQGGNDVIVEDGGRIRAEYSNGNNAIQYGSFTVTPGGAVHGLLIDDLNGDDILKALRDSSGNTFVIAGISGGPRIDTFSAYADFIEFSETSGGVVVTSGTTGSPANVRLGSSPGSLLRVTSAARYKTDIADLDVDPAALLKLRLRTWRDRQDVEADPDSDRWNVGLIAEEVVEAGLAAFVDHDEDGEPESIQYDRLAMALLAVVKDQDRRLQAVEARLAALDGQTAAAPTIR